ncbi:MAG: RecX family transcriptional regulator [Eubacteriales bacterium]|nr:RecX family transcriptional regulator [Eubacteriales bacterium]
MIYNFKKIKGEYAVLNGDGEEIGKVREATFLLNRWADGMSAEPEEMAVLIARDRADAALQCGLACIARADKSKSQVVEFLHNKGFDRKSIGYALERLEEYGYVDDARLAGDLAASAVAAGKGRYYIKNKLQQKGVDRAVMEDALAGVDPAAEYEAALASARILAAGTKEPDLRKKLAKLSRALARDGFGWDVINEALDVIREEEA